MFSELLCFWFSFCKINFRFFSFIPIFLSICIIQEKLFIQYSLQWGHISFVNFFQCKTANSFYSKINDSSRVRTTAFSSSRFGVRVSFVPNIFTIYTQHFLIPESSETLKGSFTKFFGNVRPKNFDGKTWYPLLCIKFFYTPNFLKHWRDAHEIFRHCETKNFPRKNVIPPSMHKIFRYPKFSEALKGCPRNFSALWYQKFSTDKRDTPFSFIKLFETKNFLKNSRIPLRKFSALWT